MRHYALSSTRISEEERISVYLDLTHLFWIFIIVLGFFYWWHAYGIKQLALQKTKAYCERMDIQMLDESIALNRISIRRDTEGRVALVRVFRFEFTSTGDERYQGLTSMHGRRCTHIQLEAHRI